jgi:hypothetical protein
MSKNSEQDSALDRLVTLVSTAAQQTVLRGIVDLIENQEYTTTPIRDWCNHEIDRLQKLKEGLG